MASDRHTRRAGSRGAARVALALAAALPSCANDVAGHVPAGVVVATYRSRSVDLGKRRTFAIVTRVGVVSNDPSAPPVDSPSLLASVTSHLEARGFVKAGDVDPASTPATQVAADLAVNVTALESDRPDPGWLASPGHAAPSAWGYPGYAWTYDWQWLPIAFGRGTVLVEIADLSGATPGGAQGSTPLPVGWAGVCLGAALVPAGYDASLVLESIDRAFSQSPDLVAAP